MLHHHDTDTVQYTVLDTVLARMQPVLCQRYQGGAEAHGNVYYPCELACTSYCTPYELVHNADALLPARAVNGDGDLYGANIDWT